MNRNFLKGLLGENATKEIIDEILNEAGKDIEAEKAKFNELKNQLDTANRTISERDAQLEALKGSDATNLKEQIAQLQQANEDAKKAHEKELYDFKVSTALEKALTGAKSKNNKAVKALLELGEAELNDDGTIKGLDEKLKELKKTDAYLFEAEPTLKGTIPSANKMVEPNITAPKSYEDYVKLVESGE